MTDKTARGAYLAYLKEDTFRCGNGGTFADPILDTTTDVSVLPFDVLKSPPDPPIAYRLKEEYWEIGEGRSVARITDLGYNQGEVTLELGLQTAIFIYYALGACVTNALGSVFGHDISEDVKDLPSMAMLYQQVEDPDDPDYGSAYPNDILMGIYGIVVSNINITVEQGAEITMSVDLMSARSENLETTTNHQNYPLDNNEDGGDNAREARFTLKVFTYEDFIHPGSWIKYADAEIDMATSSAVAYGAVSSFTTTSLEIDGFDIDDVTAYGTTANALAGYLIHIYDGQGKGQIRYLDASTSGSSVLGTWTDTGEDPWTIEPTTAGDISYVQILDAGYLFPTGVSYSPFTSWVVGAITTPTAVLQDLVGENSWNHVDSLEIGITNTLELKPCIGSGYPAKFVVGKREYSLRIHLYPQNHKTLLDLRNTRQCDYTGPIMAKIKFVDGCAGITAHALEFTHTDVYLADFPDHIPDWDEVIVGIDAEFRNNVGDQFTVNAVDDLAKTDGHYEST